MFDGDEGHVLDMSMCALSVIYIVTMIVESRNVHRVLEVPEPFPSTQQPDGMLTPCLNSFLSASV